MKHLLFTLAVCLPLTAAAQVFNVRSVDKVTLPGEGKVVAAISPDGSHLLLTGETNRGLESFDLKTGQTKTLTTAQGAGYDVRYAPDGKTIVYHETSFTPLRMTALKSINPETGAAREITPASRDLQGFTLNGTNASVVRAGKLKAYSLNGLKAVAAPTLSISNRQLMMSKGGKAKVFSPNGTQYSYLWPSISPDGQKVLYYVCGKGAYVCDLSGKNVQPLGMMRAPKWYDNNTVVGMLDTDDGEVITSSAIIAATLSGQHQTLTDATVIAQYPKPCAQAGKIAFSTPAGEAYIINLK